MMFRERRIRVRTVTMAVLTLLFMSTVLSQTFSSFVQRLESSPTQQRAKSVESFFSRHHETPFIEDDSLLHFIFYGKVSSVSVNGNLQHWVTPDSLRKIECGDSSFFYRTFAVPSNARLDYQLIVDEKYQLDPRNPNLTPSGYGLHSEVRMPKFISSPYLVQHDSIPHGTMDSVKLNMHILPPLKRYSITGRKIDVYLPPGYDTLSHLASLYVHDGFEAIDFALLPTIIDNLIAAKKIPPMIAVFIPPANRDEEYLGNRRDRFVKLICDNLVPMIDKKYKTDRSPLKRAITGISSGAHSALYTVLSRPDVFQNVGGQSSTITPELRLLTKKRSDENMFSLSLKIYLDCGRYDIKPDEADLGNYEFLTLNRRYSDLLSSLHIPHYYREFNDGHEWASWRERMPDMLIYFFGR